MLVLLFVCLVLFRHQAAGTFRLPKATWSALAEDLRLRRWRFECQLMAGGVEGRDLGFLQVAVG